MQSAHRAPARVPRCPPPLPWIYLPYKTLLLHAQSPQAEFPSHHPAPKSSCHPLLPGSYRQLSMLCRRYQPDSSKGSSSDPDLSAVSSPACRKFPSALRPSDTENRSDPSVSSEKNAVLFPVIPAYAPHSHTARSAPAFFLTDGPAAFPHCECTSMPGFCFSPPASRSLMSRNTQ